MWASFELHVGTLARREVCACRVMCACLIETTKTARVKRDAGLNYFFTLRSQYASQGV